MKGFGRRYAPDARDAAFPMRLVLDPLIDQFFPRGLPEGARHYRTGPILDQGSTGTCVAHAGVGKLAAAPIMQTPSFTPYELYRKIVLVDEWTDNDHEATGPDSGLQSGTSVRALMKVLKALGYLQHYLWATSIEDIRAWHLAGFGGVVLGIWWPDGMMAPDSDGFISYTGTKEAGHSVMTSGWNDRIRHNGRIVRATRIPNSWGRGWSEKGRAWIEADDLEKALQDEGEAAAATEIRVKTPQPG